MDHPKHGNVKIERTEYGYPDYSDISEAVTAAISDISERQGGTSGLTIIYYGYSDDIVSVVSSCRQLLCYSTSTNW